ncbi:MAG: hypothetical protein AB7W28_08630 [Armatimonadota bacterium]
MSRCGAALAPVLRAAAFHGNVCVLLTVLAQQAVGLIRTERLGYNQGKKGP